MMASLIAAQIFIPLVFIAWFAIAPPRNRLGFALQALVTAIALVAIARIGVWVFPPWWTPYLYGLLFILVLLIGFWRYKPLRKLPSSWLGWIAIIAFVAFGVFVGNEAARSWAGQLPPSVAAVELAFPLKDGNYLIVNGGSNLRINAHMKTLDETVPRFRAYRGQSYGIDIIQIDAFGLRANGIVPTDPTAYQIYGKPVLAPCSGKIVQAVDGFPDLKIPQTDLVNRAGNHVVLRCNDIDVLLAHFRSQSLLVQPGIEVRVGDRLAEVGNSGASDEPHLHISAQRPGTPGQPFSGEPLPMRFDGRYLIRGDRMSH
ncbi:MAG: M23 family metallopeptidase [Oscillatoriaceae cyanobacterium Prado104]|jgi:hypothetical protein|nr:M23 family metallopeptidase [Oscillatoriaceae cyanobacterium Prado104]